MEVSFRYKSIGGFLFMRKILMLAITLSLVTMTVFADTSQKKMTSYDFSIVRKSVSAGESFFYDNFKDWYQSFKAPKELPPAETKDIQMARKKVIANGEEVLSITGDAPEADKMSGYIKEIVKCLQSGYEPAIIPVYDKKEAAILPRLLDKYRQGK